MSEQDRAVCPRDAPPSDDSNPSRAALRDFLGPPDAVEQGGEICVSERYPFDALHRLGDGETAAECRHAGVDVA